MPLYGDTYYSPKMERPGSRHSRKGLSFGRVWGDPFALATISIAVLAWLIALVASIISAIDTVYPNYSWWCIAYSACCILGVTLMIAADSVFTYHVAATAFLANGLFLSTSSVNALVYSPKGSSEAAAAGFILLSMVMIVWIFYFGSQPQATHRRFIDSFALHNGKDDNLRSSRLPNGQGYGTQANSYIHNNQPQSAMYSANHLRGLETSSPVTGPGNSTFMGDSQPRFGGPTSPSNANNTFSSAGMDADNTPQGEAGIAAPTEYPYKARAIYSYEANPDDANEISFQKHEILEVSDVSGRWWQAKKASGETGIAPSNYLILL